jgi:hypothetical protein
MLFAIVTVFRHVHYDHIQRHYILRLHCDNICHYYYATSAAIFRRGYAIEYLFSLLSTLPLIFIIVIDYFAADIFFEALLKMNIAGRICHGAAFVISHF